MRCVGSLLAGHGWIALMKAYEIRILKNGSKAPLIFASQHTSDHAAVRKAQSLIETGDELEVWCELNCIYSLTSATRDPY
jgi:hypothetical protein